MKSPSDINLKSVHISTTLKFSGLAFAILLMLLAVQAQSWGQAPGDVLRGIEAELDEMEEKIVAHEQLIKSCMNSVGHSYEVGIPPDFLLERQIVMAEASGHQVDLEAATEALPEDVNADAVRAMNPVDREVWLDALFGPAPSTGQEGCYYETFQEAWGASPNGPDSVAIAAMEDFVGSDERVTSALGVYRSCMSDAGHLVEDTQSIFHAFIIESEQLGGDESAGADAFEQRKEAAFAAHDACVGPYDLIEELVRQEYLAEHPMLP